jgi:tryptophan-rich sensory protein
MRRVDLNSCSFLVLNPRPNLEFFLQISVYLMHEQQKRIQTPVMDLFLFYFVVYVIIAQSYLAIFFRFGKLFGGKGLNIWNCS